MFLIMPTDARLANHCLALKAPTKRLVFALIGSMAMISGACDASGRAQAEATEAKKDVHGQPKPSADQSKDTGTFAAWADFVAASTERRWKAGRVLRPGVSERPAGTAFSLASHRAPVRVHAQMPDQQVQRLLATLEDTYLWYVREGWPAWRGDGDRMGPELDVYLDVPVARGAYQVLNDGMLLGGVIDAASPFVQLAAGDEARLAACGSVALIDALLLQMDPAEAQAWRATSASYLAMLAGAGVCEGSVHRRYREPWRTPIAFEGTDPAAAAAWLDGLEIALGVRPGLLLLNVWQHSRQWTWEGVGLRSSPDLWETLSAFAPQLGLSFDQLAELSAVNAAEQALANIDAAAWRADPLQALGRTLYMEGAARASALPKHFAPEQALSMWGNAFIAIDVRGEKSQRRLRAWLEGEYGLRWFLQALRVDANGRIHSVLHSPHQKGARRFFEVELTHDTAVVIFAVTLSDTTPPDADLPDQRVRAFKLAVDSK